MKEEKSKLLQALEAKVKELTCGGMCIAYSGDDGSTLLLKLAADMKARILAVTFRSPLAPVEEAQAAQERARRLARKATSCRWIYCGIHALRRTLPADVFIAGGHNMRRSPPSRSTVAFSASATAPVRTLGKQSRKINSVPCGSLAYAAR